MHGKVLLRRFRDRPVPRVLAVLCLALGIGGATAVWTVFQAVLVRPLPFAEPDRLVAIWSTLPGTDAERSDVASAPVNVAGLAERQAVFAGVAAWRPAGLDLVEDGEAEHVTAVRAEPELFTLLGATPLRGRWLEPSDRRDPAVVVLSEGLWRRRFGEGAVVGRTVRLDGRPHRVVGVARADASLPTDVDAWVPLELERVDDPASRISDLFVVARLRAGVTVGAAQVDVDRVAGELAVVDPTLNRNRGLHVEPLSEVFAGDVRPALIALLVAVLLLLGVACMNAVNLSLLRIAEDTRDVMVRRALGASTSGVVVRSLVDGVVLTTVASALGVASAWLGVPRFLALSGIALPGGASLVDPRVVLFVVAAGLLTGVAIGLAPALAARRVDLAEALRTGGRCIVGDARAGRIREWLVVAQVAVGLLLVWGALATTSRIRALLAVDPGYRAEGALTVRVAAQPDRHAGFAGKLVFYDALRTTFSTIPGVTAVGATNALPVGDPDGYWSFSVEDRPPADPTLPEVARGRLVSPEYFEAMGVPVLAGRAFDATDRADGVPVVIVSRRLADRYWPGQDPLGRRIKRRTWDAPYPWRTVVGVVGDVRDDGLGEPAAATIYFPLAQIDSKFSDAVSFVLRADGSTGVGAEVRRRLAEVDPEAPIVRLASLDALLRESLATERFAGALLTGFAGIGLVLLIAGVYGLLALVVAERRPEIALRLALGATPVRVVRDVVSRGLLLVLLGIGVGLAGTLVARPLLARLADGTGSGVGPVIGLILAASLMAAGVPAIRAARTDPAASLDG